MPTDADRAPPPLPPVYDGAPENLIEVWNIRRVPLALGPDEALPPPDADLATLARSRIPADEPPPRARRRLSPHMLKRRQIRVELAGHSELAALNGLLIAHLRKREAPEGAAALFHRIWAEHGAQLLAELPPRWLISSAITFGDHGRTEGQRRIGLAMNMFFSLVKLYEFERFFSGNSGDQPFRRKRKAGAELPLGMPGFSLLGGGLDINLMAQVWQMAEEDDVAGPIAHRLLRLLNHDPVGLFRRLERMREETRAARIDRATATPADPADAPGPGPTDPGLADPGLADTPEPPIRHET
ncbi:hypothetical protein [Pseudogemmobacter sonorensis]|uniref:hypothetical protein n=1 Tax=Pseudogemmobacter sonorensis TaxID=2989681 RepID=UPI00369B8AB0